MGEIVNPRAWYDEGYADGLATTCTQHATDIERLMSRQLEVLRERDALQARLDAAYEALFPAVSLPVTPFTTIIAHAEREEERHG